MLCLLSFVEGPYVTKSRIKKVDLFVIGGGINGCGIARDAVGRGLSVTLAEMNDIGGQHPLHLRSCFTEVCVI